MDELIRSVYEHPEEWNVGAYTFFRGNFHLWVSNGFSFVAPYHSSGRLTLLQKWRFWRAYNWWLKNCPIEKLIGESK